ncbi:MAG: hypothetical protein ACREAD_04630 [Nitrosopumilaceae archaeon]
MQVELTKKAIDSIREDIARQNSAFSEVEREAFLLANSIIGWIHIMNSPKSGFNLEVKNRMLNDCEIQASHLLNKLKEILAIPK